MTTTIADLEKAQESMPDDGDIYTAGQWFDDHEMVIRTSLAIHAKILALRETHRMVQVEPTDSMLQNVMTVWRKDIHFVSGYDRPKMSEREIYKAMITAAKDPLEIEGK